jgi:dienelactone hydrolase
LPGGKPKANIPIVIVVHEWWGKTEYPKMRGEMLAKEGFGALVVDLFGDNQIATTPEEAKNLAGQFYKNQSLGVKRLNKYIDLLREKENFKSSKIYAIGYCFGGSQVLNLMRSGTELAGVASFHGGLGSNLPAPSKVTTPILVLNGAADKLVSDEEVKKFKSEMEKAKADLTFINYPEALHAFTNPKATEVGQKFNMPVAYNKKADEASWLELMKFLKK